MYIYIYIYTHLHMRGAGACGVVSKGVIKKTGQQVAIKTVKARGGGGVSSYYYIIAASIMSLIITIISIIVKDPPSACFVEDGAAGGHQSRQSARRGCFTWGIGCNFTNYIFRRPLSFKSNIEFQPSGKICCLSAFFFFVKSRAFLKLQLVKL